MNAQDERLGEAVGVALKVTLDSYEPASDWEQIERQVRVPLGPEAANLNAELTSSGGAISAASVARISSSRTRNWRFAAPLAAAVAVATLAVGAATLKDRPQRVAANGAGTGTSQSTAMSEAVPPATATPSGAESAYFAIADPDWRLEEFSERRLSSVGPGPVREPDVRAAFFKRDNGQGMVSVSAIDQFDPSMVGESSKEFSAGVWSGVIGEVFSDWTPFVAKSGDRSVYGRASGIDEAELTRVLAGLAPGKSAFAIPGWTDQIPTLSPTFAEPAQYGSWETTWVGPRAQSVSLTAYFEGANAAGRFLDRAGATSIWIDAKVGETPAVILDPGGYTVMTWFDSAVSIVELRVHATGPTAVDLLKRLGSKIRHVDADEMSQIVPPSLLVDPATVVSLIDNTPLPTGSSWTEFGYDPGRPADHLVLVAATQFAACKWLGDLQMAKREGDATRVAADSAAIQEMINRPILTARDQVREQLADLFAGIENDPENAAVESC